MNKIKLRNLNDNDVDFILENWSKDNSLPGYHFKNSRKEILNLINQWNIKSYKGMYFEMYLIEADNKNVGLLSLYQHNTNSLSIGISIQPQFQNKGIAANAIKIATSTLKDNGWTNLLSQCRIDNAESVALHKKCGFKIIDRRINNKSHEVFIWNKQLI